jgi:RNA polymerase sigma-70 factor (ECF subfamily)
VGRSEDIAHLELEARQACSAGDTKRALGLLMRLHGDAVYRLCRGLVVDADLAADVHQTVFVEAYRDLSRFDGRSSFKTWLNAIARHRCLDALKTTRRRNARFQTFGGASEESRVAEVPDEAPTPEAVAAQASTRVPLERCLEALQPNTRSAVLLRYQEASSYDELGRLFGEQPGTIQARVARALPVLRKCLEGAGVSAA